MTRRYRSNPAVVPVPFPVPLPITQEQAPQIPPPSPTAIQFTCFGIPVYQRPSVPNSYAEVNTTSQNTFYGCSGDTCFEAVEGLIIKGYVFLPLNLYAYIFACEGQTESQTSEIQGTQTIIVITESTQLYNTDQVIQINQVIQGQFKDKSEVLTISYGDIDIKDINHLSFIRTGLQIATIFSIPLYDRLSVFKTPFKIVVPQTFYLEANKNEILRLFTVINFMQSLDAEISKLIQTEYQIINQKGGLTNVVSKPVQNQLPLQIMPSITFGDSYQFQNQLPPQIMPGIIFGKSYGLNADTILTQTQIETEIGEPLYVNNITFETELTIQQS